MIYATNYFPAQAWEIKKSHSAKSDDTYLERWLSLDTETSHNHAAEPSAAVGWIYQWAFVFGKEKVIGRKPSELMQVLHKLVKYYELGNGKRLVIYIHNASYDLQYLKDWLYKEFGNYKILATKEHHIISYTNDFFQIRCSYVLSNKSLAKWAKDLGCTARKKEGLIDYHKIRFQWDKLESDDWEYMLGDVDTLDECVERQLDLFSDSVATVPLTSTSYIRRTCRYNFQKNNKNWKSFTRTRLNATTYTLFRAEFAGGLTHGDRFRAGLTVKPGSGETIRHRDFRSHYPSQQRTRQFPLGMYNLYCRNATIEEIQEKLKDNCILVKCTITNAAIKSASVTFPTLQVSKCLEGKKDPINLVKDNGRVLEVHGTTTLVFNEYDLKWFLRLYNYEKISYDELYTASRGYLPEFMRETIDDYFRGKTEFKIKARREKDPRKKLDYELSLMKSKNGLNGIYGMTAQQSVRAEYEMLPEPDETGSVWNVDFPEDLQGALDKFYNNRNNFMRYQWGCHTTSAARDELLTFIYDVIGADRCIYCDTDSIFYLSDDATENRIEEYNKKLLKQSEDLGAFIEYEGEKVHYNQFEQEEDSGHITAFRFLHAKCYAFQTDDHELHCTIAGVVARVVDYLDSDGQPVYYTREKELGTLDELRPGKIFYRCGGASVAYYERMPEVSAEFGEVASSAIITNVTKTLKSEVQPHIDLFLDPESEVIRNEFYRK